MAKAPVIEDPQLRHMLKVAAISGESKTRNVALLTAIYGTGMMPTELARMTVRTYLNADGTVRVKSCIPADISFNGKERPLYWSNNKVVAAINAYLDYRVAHRQRMSTKPAVFRGLDPDGPIFLTGEGEPYKLIARPTSGGAISYACDSVSQLFRKLHLQAGLDGASAMSGRRTFAVRLHRKGFDLRHINELLGHATLSATKQLIDADPIRLGAIVAKVI